MKRFYSQEEIFNIWSNKLDFFPKDERFNIYVDNPFCISRCLYCKHTGSKLKDNLNDYEDYYRYFLPTQIRFFNPLLKKKVPNTIYFGGGSPNIMSLNMMEVIFKEISNFKKVKNKVFECSPNLLEQKKIDSLIKNNFTYVSFGIQTLKEKVLKHNNRAGYKKVPLKEYISNLEKGGVRVNCDLMIFIGEEKENIRKEIRRVKEDFKELVEKYQPSFITIYPETNFLLEDEKRGIHFLKEFRKMILSLRKDYNLKYWDKHLSLEEKEIAKEIHLCYHFSMTELEDINEAKEYKSDGPPYQPVDQNVLSFGGYKHHQPYSYHGKSFVYYNLNENNKEFKYFGEEFRKKKMKFTNMDVI
jgi:radical SAM superfamily enzyme YgiQ (UPF0313 family)